MTAHPFWLFCKILKEHTHHIKPESLPLGFVCMFVLDWQGNNNNCLLTQVYAFNVEANSLARGFPKHIRDVFPAVESGDHPDGNIDAAYFSYTHNAVFLLKGTRYWRVLGNRERWRRPFLPRNGLLPHKEVDQQWFDICNVHPTALKLSRWDCCSGDPIGLDVGVCALIWLLWCLILNL